ncbi:MAG: high-potential iron-sulfur protein [Leptospiraceae bacterium]|nr:high-potential iron-sulfur protein [Leptospiraceae bacterium]
MDKYSRKDFLKRGLVAGAAIAGAGTFLSYCRKPADEGSDQAALSCDDTTGLSEADIATRTQNGYVDISSKAGQTCSNCALYTQPTGGSSCGGCQAVKGPINPAGWCNLWVAQG